MDGPDSSTVQFVEKWTRQLDALKAVNFKQPRLGYLDNWMYWVYPQQQDIGADTW